jgi:large subunit ribosomal protein L28
VATQCDICGRGTAHGRNIRHRHAGRWERKAPVTNRIYRANVHKRVIYVDGKRERVSICTRCLRNQLKAAV